MARPPAPVESEGPSIIHQAMRYSVFAGGKRLRPILTIATGEVFSAASRRCFPPHARSK